jgi:hypothetical protein
VELGIPNGFLGGLISRCGMGGSVGAKIQRRCLVGNLRRLGT